MTDAADWMIYGANGYTGRMIAQEAVRRGLRPVLAGRSAAAIEPLAVRLGCPSRTFGLDDSAAEHLAGIRVVLHCAGPFSATARPMMDACLRAGATYLDITGEIDVIELAASRHEETRRAGVAVIPAVGFDIVPSDCLAAQLAAALPSAQRLMLAFESSGGLSPGTAKTSLESLPHGGRVRIDGRIERVPTAWKTREIDFPGRRLSAVTIPWGDVAGAFYSTGIKNIEVYVAMPPGQVRQMRRLRWLLPLAAWGPIQRFARRRIERTVPGPSAQELSASRASFWGRVEDDQGRFAEATLETPGGYPLTVETSLMFVAAALAGQLPAGFSTPSRALGKDIIERVPGCKLTWRHR
ncbi:MAG TPA: saccharopine dehydrogenase NADP-binding domain-containing protein [Pirellulales bacterium]|nr:saccharopine dehydrogenase NADP-binding domain-containing protein [Pirellulales bacterium]